MHPLRDEEIVNRLKNSHLEIYHRLKRMKKRHEGEIIELKASTFAAKA